MKIRFFSLVMICLFTAHLRAELQLSSVITDHAVLQRDRPIHLWGQASPAEKISIKFHDQSVVTTATNEGLWEAWLMAEPAGGPFTLTVEGSAKLTRSDLLVGDVWFASGQSNMEMPLAGFGSQAHVTNSAEEIAHANLPQIRLLRIEKLSSPSPVAGISAAWQVCTPETAKDFSAVAYFFGRDIQRQEKVPIGLIDSSWGGTPIDAWISLDALSSDASLMPAFASRAHFGNTQTYRKLIEAAEKRADAEAAAHSQPAPVHPWYPDPDSWIPAALYNGMVAPITPYTIKGFLWYQGETDAVPDRMNLYARLMPALIGDWRQQWHQGNLPFFMVQISSFGSNGETWGVVRDSQRRTLDVAKTGMAVSLDVGQRDNIHPPDKQSVGARLALAARAVAYNEPGLEFSGPLYRQTTREGQGLRIWFDHAEGLQSKGATLQGFEVAGPDGHFVPATAKVDGLSVVVSAAQVAQPTQVRYAWQDFTEATLYNSAALPASTFIADVP